MVMIKTTSPAHDPLPGLGELGSWGRGRGGPGGGEAGEGSQGKGSGGCAVPCPPHAGTMTRLMGKSFRPRSLGESKTTGSVWCGAWV